VIRPAPRFGKLFTTCGAETVNFDNATAGQPPPGWTATKTGSGTAKWTIERDDNATSKPNVLKRSGQATFPICFKDDTSLLDGFVEVKFKPISGKEDQAGGVVWRLRDATNYYIARANALEDNVTIYHLAAVNIRRKPLAVPALHRETSTAVALSSVRSRGSR
jgi:hypothetical protein